MKKFLDKLAAKVAAKPREAAIALLVTSAGWLISGLVVLAR